MGTGRDLSLFCNIYIIFTYTAMIHRYLKTTSLLLILFLADIVFGQRTLYPFDDYSKCQIGFTNIKRDTVYRAKFENLKEIDVFDFNKTDISDKYRNGWDKNSWNSWILSENGKFGCLSDRGVWLLPCKYESVLFEPYFYSFIVQLNGKSGVVSVGDTLRIPIEFDNIFPETNWSGANNAFYVRKGELLGIYSVSGKQLVAPEYERIERLADFYEGSSETGEYFIVSKNGLVGVVAGNSELIAPEYRSIRTLRNYISPGSKMQFLVQDTLGRFSVFSGEGKQLLPFREEEIQPVYTLSTDREIKYVDRKDVEDRHQFVNLATGKESEWYQGLNFIGNEIFAYSIQNGEDEWGYRKVCDWKILDSNFNVIYSNSETTDQLLFWSFGNDLEEAEHFPNHYEEEELSMYKQELLRYGINYAPSVYVIRKTIPYTEKELKKLDIWDDKEYYSLLNGKTGKQSPFIYNDVYRISGKKRFYYWGVRISGPEFYDDELTIDIYDSSATFLQTICMEWEEFESVKNSGYMNPYQNVFELLIINNKVNKKGIIRSNGNRITPCVFDGEMVIYGMKDNTGIIYCKQDNKYKLYDLLAQPLFGGASFDELRYHDENTFSLKSGDHYTFFSSKLVILLDSCSAPVEVSSSLYVRLNKTCRVVVEKGGYYYGLFDDGFHVMNSDVFKSPSEENWLGKDIYIDKSGKAVSRKPTGPIVDHFDMIYVTLANKELKVQNPKKELIQIIKDVDHYTWRNGRLVLYMISGKEGLLNTTTGKWSLKPVYSHVNSMYPGREDAFWAKDKSVDPKKWFIVKPDGTRISEPVFDTTFQMEKGAKYQSFVSNGLIGFVNNKFETATVARFQKSIEVNQKTFWVDQNTFHLLNTQTGKTFEVKRDVACESFPLGHLFLFNDSIQVLGLDGKELLSPMPLNKALLTVNLNNYLYSPAPPERSLPFVGGNQLFYADSDTVLWRQNNQNLVERAKQQVVSIASLRKVDFRLLIPVDCKIEPEFANKYLYSEIVRGVCYEQPLCTESKRQDHSYRNYFIEPTGLVPLVLSDLFIEGSDYENKLDELLQAAIQRGQLFGTNCPDMPGVVREFKRNFYLAKDCIWFEYYPQGKMIRVMYKSLKELLKHPDYFE